MPGETVLAVDDREDSLKFLHEYVLQSNGYQTIQASNGADALEIALSRKIDLIISDLLMPKMGGLELLKCLREKELDIPTILMTFHGSEGTAVDAFRLGARDYIIKPFTIAEMTNAINRALSESRLLKERDRLTQKVLTINQQLENRVQELRFLYGIGRSVTSLQDLEQVLNRIVEAAAYLTNAEEGALMLIDEESGDLYLRAARGLNEKKSTSFRIKTQDSIAGHVVQSGHPVMIGGKNQDDSFRVTTGYFVKSLLNVPLKVKDRVIGVLAVNNKTTVRAFTERHLNLLIALADYATIAIENTRLYASLSSEANEAKQSSRQLKNLVETRTSELEAVSQQLLKTEKLAALGYMAAGVVKEMNSPINNILDTLYNLQSSIETNPENFEAVATIERDILRCQQTIQSLLNFSGPQNFKTQEIYLNDLIEAAWARYNNEEDVSQTIDFVRGFDPQLPLIPVDGKQIELAFYYLIRNAYRSMSQEGTLRITSRAVGSELQVIISDSGAGLSPDDLRHIFDPFYSNNHQSYGLDLSISQAVIQRHHGTIEVESESGQGTTFTIHLPRKL